MAVDQQHPDYTDKLTRWHKQRDAYMGEDAVKEAGQTYLHRPDGFKNHHFQRYVDRAKWYGATARTIGGWTGAVFQKPMEVAVSNEQVFTQHRKNITLTGISLDAMGHVLLRDIELMGRYGILVDWSESEKRPYWAGYPAECIINWRTETRGGVEILTMVVLHERVEQDRVDQFEVKFKDQYRVAHLNSEGQYQIDIWESRADTEMEAGPALISQVIPQRRQAPLHFIPFQFFGAENLTPDIYKSPSEDLVDLNFAYYRHSADYEHGLYLTGLPTPVVTGHTNPDDVLLIGSMTAWILPETEAKAYYLEYQGMGLESHERAMDNDKVEMSTLGARLLEESPGVPETLGAVQLRHTGDLGSLKSIAMLTSEGLSRVLRWHAWWAGDESALTNESIRIDLNTDLISSRLKAQDLQALMLTWQQGGMSQETFLWNLQQGELLPPGVSVEDEISRLETQPPARLPFGEDDASEEAA